MSSSQNPDIALSLTLSSPTSTHPQPQPMKREERGIRLIQLLLACANHASSGNLHRADSCLRQISQLSSMAGDSMQRLAAWFASALAVKLVHRWPGIYKALIHPQLSTQYDLHGLAPAQSTFSQALPYLGFAYSVVGRTLHRTMLQEPIIHIVALGSHDISFWVSIVKSFGLMRRRPPHLRITSVHSSKEVLDNLGKELAREADKLYMPFEFNPVDVNLKELTTDMIKAKPEETLAFVSILSLHVLLSEDDRIEAQFSSNKSNTMKDSKTLDEFLAMIKSTSPKVVLVVEQEADHNHNRLGDRFVESLHYYSALFDSIDVTFQHSDEERCALEAMFGREIENIVACEGLERVERHERYIRWMVRFGGAGLKPVRMWFDVAEETKRVIENYKEGYKVISDKGSLMICWHGRPLYAISAWSCTC